MKKEELIEAILATIATNGQKGITAESLANILVEMVNASGEGGSGQVVFYFGVPNEGYTAFSLTPEEQAHNAEMFQIVKNSPVALAVSLDMSRGMIEVEGPSMGIDMSGLKFNTLVMTSRYYPAELAAAMMGTPNEIVALEELMVNPDGTVSPAPTA